MSLDFDEIYSEIAPSVFRYLRRLTGSRAQAEDVLQETFLKFHVQMASETEIQHYRAWLFRVATNEVKDRRRREVRSAIREENYAAKAEVIDFQSHLENRQIVRRGLSHLSPRMKQVLLLSAEGFSYREISVIADVEAAYVGVLIQRARVAFKKYFEEEDERTKKYSEEEDEQTNGKKYEPRKMRR